MEMQSSQGSAAPHQPSPGRTHTFCANINSTSNSNNGHTGSDLFRSKKKKNQEAGTITMPPAADALGRSTTTTTTTTATSPKVVIMVAPPSPLPIHQQGATKAENYYKAGSSEKITETKLTVSRLETRRRLTKTSDRLVIVLVGLPARGKSFLSRKLLHYVNWTGVKCKAFNVGKYRREAAAAATQETSSSSNNGACDANFFAADNAEAANLRQRVAQFALDDMLDWLDEEDEDYWDEGSVMSRTTRHNAISQKIAIFDATNSTEKRRQWVLQECTAPEKRGDKKTGVIFVESICTDQELLEENYRFKVSNSPDYKDMSVEEGLEDLLKRVRNYEDQYETIANDSYSYIKIFDLSTKLMVNHIYGRMAKDLVPALMAWHIGSRPIFLLRPGRTVSGNQCDHSADLSNNSSDNLVGNSILRRHNSTTSINSKRRRGDALCPEGIAFRRSLWTFLYSEVKDFITKRRSVVDNKNTGTSISGLVDAPKFTGDAAEEIEENLESGMLPIRVLTSTMPRAVQTVTFDEYDIPCSQMSNLNPIDKGDFAGMELDDIKAENPIFFHHLQSDAFKTRFPGGESYHDLVRRLKPIVIDVEQQVVPVVVVSHVSILQCLMAYFRNTSVQSCMTAEVPMHTVIKFEPARGGGWQESWHPLECQPSSEEVAHDMVAVPSLSEFSTLTMEPEYSTHGEHPIWEAETGPIRRTSLQQLRKQMTT